jgi:hypothetical protein
MSGGQLHASADEAGTPSVKLLYNVPEAIAVLGHSRSSLYQAMNAGRIKSVMSGGRRYFTAAQLGDYVALLVAEAEASHDDESDDGPSHAAPARRRTGPAGRSLHTRRASGADGT